MKMKRLAAAVTALTMAASAFPAAVGAADDTSRVKLTFNGSEVPFADSEPFLEDDTVFVPIRAAAEHLGLSVSHDPAAQTVRLSTPSGEITFRTVGNSANVGGAAVSFEPASVLKSDRVFVPLSFFENVLGLSAEYSQESNTAELSAPEQAPADPEALVSQFMQLLMNREYQALSDRWFSEELKAELPVEALAAGWESAAPLAGSFLGVSGIRSDPIDERTIAVTAVAEFEHIDFHLTLAVNAEQRLAGIFLTPAPVEQEAPADIKEEEVVVGEGTPFELGGTLALPANAEGPLPAVVLVQGSGASDRDETAAAYKPFRDLAWGLAQQGIAVLRYDKRTYVYGEKSVPEEGAVLTVKEETVDDAVAAANLLKADERIDPSRVYIVGHSQGGMLAPRIDAEGGDFAGLVLLAGSPRTLWEIIYDQNMMFIETMDDADPAKAASASYVEAEYQKALRIAGMTDEEAKAETVFGIPAYYFKEMDAFDWDGYAAALDKPVLVLQGEDDFQVYPDKDFALYREQIGDFPSVTFKLYPGLNHFFVDYSGPGEGTTAEYSVPGQVDPAVIDDIAAWIKSQN